MKNNKINYAMVGGFVLSMIAALVVAIAVLTGRTGATDTYYTVYDEVSGVDFGTKVLFDGYHIGQVEKVVPSPDENKAMHFRIEMSVKKDWRIPDNSIARQESGGLLSAVVIEIHEGDSRQVLSPGDEILPGKSADLFAAVAQIGSDVGEVTHEGLMPLLKNMNKQVDRVGELLDNDVQNILDDVHVTTSAFAEEAPIIVANLKGATEKLDEILSEDNAQAIDRSIANVEKSAQNMADFTDGLQTTKAKLEEMVSTIDDMVTGNKANVDKTIEDLRYSMETVARHIDGILKNLDGTSRNMYEFSRQIRLNPALLLSGNPPRDEAKSGGGGK